MATISQGNSLFGDFDVTLGFDNDPDVPTDQLKPVIAAWSCEHCGAGGDGFDTMVEHARSHFTAELRAAEEPAKSEVA